MQPPVQAYTGAEARNAVLFSFREFWLGTSKPKPNTIEALNYIPWKPERTMREYCNDSIQQFKPIADLVNSPLKTFDFKLFADLITSVLALFFRPTFVHSPLMNLQEINYLVPVAKMIQFESTRYAAFDRFPLGAKVFVNAVVAFIDAADLYKKKPVNVANRTSEQDPDQAHALSRRDDLIETLKMLLATMKQILQQERLAM
jgi:hypothetical protein